MSALQTTDGGWSGPGHAIIHGVDKKTVSGQLSLTPAGVGFVSENVAYDLPNAGLQINLGGNDGNIVFFKHPDISGVTLYSADSTLLKSSALRAHSAAPPEVRAFREAKAWPKFATLILVFLAIVTIPFLILLSQKDKMVESLAAKVPLHWEEQLGDQVFASLKSEKAELSEESLVKEIEKITAQLRKGIAEHPYNFRFHILDDTNINAFALPGGHVVILKGLIQAADTPEEIAGVLAHEIAHVTRKHSIRKMIDSAGLYVLFQLLVGDASAGYAILNSGSRMLLNQKFSRDFEREADEVGWGYLTTAQIDPRGLKSFFGKLEKLEAQRSSGVMTMELLNTHPATAERIARLAEKEKSLGAEKFVPISADLALLKNKLKAIR